MTVRMGEVSRSRRGWDVTATLSGPGRGVVGVDGDAAI